MAADVYHIVDAAHYPVVSVLVAACAVARKIIPWGLGPRRFLVPIVVAPDRPQHRRPWMLDNPITAFADTDRFAALSNDIDKNNRQRTVSSARPRGPCTA